MNFLQIQSGLTILKIQLNSELCASLDEQAEKFLSQSPFLLLDVQDIDFNSMQIGELVNLRKAYDAQWSPKVSKIGLLNLNEHGKRVFKTTKLDQHFMFFDSIDDALKQFTAE